MSDFAITELPEPTACTGYAHGDPELAVLLLELLGHGFADGEHGAGPVELEDRTAGTSPGYYDEEDTDESERDLLCGAKVAW